MSASCLVARATGTKRADASIWQRRGYIPAYRQAGPCLHQRRLHRTKQPYRSSTTGTSRNGNAGAPSSLGYF
ncbi:MAG: hypothetical protein L0Y80_11085 [Ignavibacteriae bacterium]|nr:hypothetical protein [Ignavibacteriota bacterium]